MRLALVACLASVLACIRPLPAPERPRPALRVAVAWDLAPWRTQIASGAAMLRRAGVPVVLVPRGAAADVTIVHGDDAVEGCAYAGMYTAALHRIEIWPACAAGSLELAAVVAHELCHHLGAEHVLPSRGVAIMNPRIPAAVLGECDPFVTVCTGPIPPLDLEPLDIQELQRVHALPAR